MPVPQCGMGQPEGQLLRGHVQVGSRGSLEKSRVLFATWAWVLRRPKHPTTLEGLVSLRLQAEPTQEQGEVFVE